MNRLRAFRDIEMLNQGDLADLLDISVPMVSAIESGRRTFSGDLEQLGYSHDRLSLPDMSEPIHRARASTSVAAKKRAKELLRLAGEVFGDMRGQLLAARIVQGGEGLVVETKAAPLRVVG